MLGRGQSTLRGGRRRVSDRQREHDYRSAASAWPEIAAGRGGGGDETLGDWFLEVTGSGGVLLRWTSSQCRTPMGRVHLEIQRRYELQGSAEESARARMRFFVTRRGTGEAGVSEKSLRKEGNLVEETLTRIGLDRVQGVEYSGTMSSQSRWAYCAQQGTGPRVSPTSLPAALRVLPQERRWIVR